MGISRMQVEQCLGARETIRFILYHAIASLAVCLGVHDAHAQSSLETLLSPGLKLEPRAVSAGPRPGSVAVEGGAVQVSIPIEVPPGTAKLQPAVALSVSSPAQNGLAGIGARIEGLSAIARCGTRIEPHGFIDPVDFDENDQLCLDGQLLIKTRDGYRTEIDAFSKVVPVGGTANAPARFRVFTKDGRILEYGGSSDSYIEAQGRSEPVVWALNRVEDRFGNYFTVTYGEVTELGLFAPLRIDYTGNDKAGVRPYNSVRFRYEPRDDVASGFLAGSIRSTPIRLRQVETYADLVAVRAYELRYETSASTGRSRLVAVQECAFDSPATPTCLPATEMFWQEGQNEFEPSAIWLGLNAGPGGALTYSDRNEQFTGDFNGDGLSDLMWNRNGWQVALSTGAGFSRPTTWLSANGGPGGVPTNNPEAKHQFVADFNGDGLSDLIWHFNGWNVALSTGSGFARPTRWFGATGPGGVPSYNPEGHEFIADFNGDGRADVMWSFNGWHVALSNGTSFDPASTWLGPNGGPGGRPTVNLAGHQFVGDLNGDGLSDLMWSHEGWHVALSHGDGFDTPRTWLAATAGPRGVPVYNPSGLHQFLADLNGDGLSDYMWNFDGWHVALSTGASFERPTTWLSQTGPGGVPSINPAGHHYLRDLNGDGFEDYMWSFNGWHVALSTGAGFQPATTWIPATVSPGAAPSANPSGHQFVDDFDGDGLADFMWSFNGWRVAAHAGELPDVLVQTIDGLGVVTQIDYAPLTDRSVYTKGSGSAYPVVDVQAPMYVARESRRSDGIGGMRRTQYAYSGLRTDARRAIALGFERIRIDDPVRGVRATTVYSQKFPEHGQVQVSESAYIASGVALSRVSHAWKVESVLSIPSNSRSDRFYHLFPVETVEEQFETSGEFVGATTTIREFDSFGNITSEQVSQYDGQVNTTLNEYDSDEASWLLGCLLREETRARKPGFPEQVRVMEASYVRGLGVVASQAIEPDRPQLRMESAFEYDGFGNVVSTTVTGFDYPKRTAKRGFDQRGRYEITKVNEIGHTQTLTYDSRHGNITSSQGADPAVAPATYAYDAFGRPTKKVVAGVSNEIRYEACKSCPPGAVFQLTSRTQGRGAEVRYFDALGRVIRAEGIGLDGTPIYTDTQYDPLGRNVSTTRPYLRGSKVYAARFQYDVFDRTVREIAPDGGVTTLEYSPDTVEATNPLGQTKREVRDSLGQTVEVRDSLGGVQKFSLDPFGNPVLVIDAMGNRVESEFDARGRRTRLRDPDLGEREFVFNAGGQVIREVDARGQVMAAEYDLLGRIVRRMSPEGTTRWEYDTAENGVGLLARVTAPDLGYERVHRYDRFARPISAKVKIQAVTYESSVTYDNLGRRNVDTYPSGFRTRRLYNQHGHLVEVANAETGEPFWTAAKANASGQLLEERLGKNLVTQRRFDPETGRIEEIRTSSGSSQVQDLAYSWDRVGNLELRRDRRQGLSESFRYDELNRLTQSQVEGASPLAFEYDAVGNITFKTGVGRYRYGQNGAGPHAVTETSEPAVTYGYDPSGNMVSSSAGRSITYTSFSKPVLVKQTTAAGGRPAASFFYGPDFEEIRRVDVAGTGEVWATKTFVSAHFETEANSNGDLLQKHYIPGGDGIAAVYILHKEAAPETQYLHRDHLGSIDTITDSFGKVIERRSYDAHGKLRDALDWDGEAVAVTPVLDQGFTGHRQLSSLGLVHMKARLYDPVLGRFLSADPTVQFPNSTQGFNRYAYVNNNPLSFTDPSGFGLKRYLKKAASFQRRVVRKAAKVLVRIADDKGGLLALGIFSASVGGIVTTAIFAKPFLNAARFIAAGGSIGEAARNLGKLVATFAVAAIAALAQQYYVLPGLLAALGTEAAVASLATATTLATSLLSYVQIVAPYVLSGAIVGGVSSGLIAAINGQNVGEGFARGAALGGLLGFLAGNARFARAVEVVGSSKANPGGNPAGLSDGGPAKDGIKLGGGRVLSDAAKRGEGFRGLFGFIESKGGVSYLGGNQTGPGSFFGVSYSSSGPVNYLVESFAGPHDFLQHFFFYNSNGQLKALTGVTGFFSAQLSPFINIANVGIAAPFATSFAVPAAPGVIGLDLSSQRELRNLP